MTRPAFLEARLEIRSLNGFDCKLSPRLQAMAEVHFAMCTTSKESYQSVLVDRFEGQAFP